MGYIVTHGKFGPDDEVAPIVIDQGEPGKPFGLDDALNQARFLLSEGKLNVAIEDASGNTISGDDLAACYRGEKK